MIVDQREHPKTFTMQMRVGASHFTVTVPSTSLSQKHEPEILSPQSAFCMMMQLAMNLKFLLTLVIFFKIQDEWLIYIIAYLISPYLSFIHVVVFVCEMAADDRVDLFLHEGTNVVEDGLLLFAHLFLQFINTIKLNSNCSSQQSSKIPSTTDDPTKIKRIYALNSLHRPMHNFLFQQVFD